MLYPCSFGLWLWRKHFAMKSSSLSRRRRLTKSLWTRDGIRSQTWKNLVGTRDDLSASCSEFMWTSFKSSTCAVIKRSVRTFAKSMSYSNNIAYLAPSPKTRQKINGAKAHCLALGESHTRPASQCHIEGSAIVHLQRRRNAYDGEMEYFVVVKETARSTEESSYEHQHSKRMKAADISWQ